MSAAPPAVKHASVNGVDLVYLEQGQGAPVVFVHGAFSDHRAWEGQREAVAQRHRYIALTQRYFGTAPWPDSGEKYSLATGRSLSRYLRKTASLISLRLRSKRLSVTPFTSSEYEPAKPTCRGMSSWTT
jgi:pimeloyl-ACP methyl ester carboxylesterase